MKAVQISARTLDRLNKFIKNQEKVTRTQFINRAVDFFSTCLSNRYLRRDYKPLKQVQIEEEGFFNDRLKAGKENYKKPMYNILSACIDAYLDYLQGNLKKRNIAIVQFFYFPKKYVFYFDPETNIRVGDIAMTRVKNHGKTLDQWACIRAVGYLEGADKKYKSLIKIRHFDDLNDDTQLRIRDMLSNQPKKIKTKKMKKNKLSIEKKDIETAEISVENQEKLE